MRILFLLLLGLMGGATSATAQVVVIAHESVPVDGIERTELLDYYTGDKRFWADGQAVVVVDLKPKTELKTSFYGFLGKSPARMKSIWMKNLLSGEGDPPQSLPDEAAILTKISTTPGAIGFVSRQAFLEAPVGVKQLRIIDPAAP